MTTPTPTVIRNVDRSRFELRIDGELAGVLDYRLAGGLADMFHTEVLTEYRGRGLAAILARAALHEAREQGWRIVPSCSYLHGYVAAHPEEEDLVA